MSPNLPQPKPMSWLGQIRTHRRDEAWSDILCQTFFATSMGAQIPVIAEKPLSVEDQQRRFTSRTDPLQRAASYC
jgi:hypothetical protein